jgi:hypothetical protein
MRLIVAFFPVLEHHAGAEFGRSNPQVLLRATRDETLRYLKFPSALPSSWRLHRAAVADRRWLPTLPARPA